METKGSIQQRRIKRLGIKPMHICVEADDLSMATLIKFFKDEPVMPSTQRRIVDAINRLESRLNSKAAG